ncbi:MFS transporter [Gordonia paraffinivorans]|uniref:MFS transporter n=2 Tax=Gordonia paraffinivorans TaxID=175628 RepID=UPI001C92C796|nr:MFS transporter [Gordonia paraffinivorans]
MIPRSSRHDEGRGTPRGPANQHGQPPPADRGRRSAPHPGSANYPADETRQMRSRRPAPGWGPSGNPGPGRNAYLPPPTHNPHLPPLDDRHQPPSDESATRAMPNDRDPRAPKKLTVMRVAAMRSRELTSKGIGKIYKAATADGADQSGLTALTLPVIANFAADAAMAVALANTLFFAAATGESKTNVALYLALTIAPFALIAPLIGPLLDRLQRGRRIAMATTFGLRVVLALLIMSNVQWNDVKQQLEYDPWVLYPCALGLLVLSKSFGVLKSAVTPRVVPPTIDLPRVNSRLTTFGLIGGTIVGGALAALVEMVLGKLLPLHLPGAMLWLAIVAAAGAYLCMRIPSWVEVTEGEIPTTITYHGEPARTSVPEHEPTSAREGAKMLAAKMRQPLGRTVVAGLWGNGTIRILTGFLTLFVAFYAKAQQGNASDWTQLLLLGLVGAAAGVGNAIGNGVGTRLELKNPPNVIVWSTAACFVVAVLAAIFGNIMMAAVAALIASGTSAIGKVCLDSSIQDDLPDESRASAFGRSETVLQLSWVFGASLGVLLPPTLWIGFTVVSVLLGLGLLQTVMTTRGSSLVPGLGGRRPDHAAPTVSFRAAGTESRSHADSRSRADGPGTRRAGPGSAPTRPHTQRPTTARMPSTAHFENPGDHTPDQTGHRRP